MDLMVQQPWCLTIFVCITAHYHNRIFCPFIDEWWDAKYFNHVAEKRTWTILHNKNESYPKCLLILSIIIDAMDQNKTRIPYFDRPDKCIASEQGLKTKLFAAIVHGFGVYLFWCTTLIQTGSNLTIEVLHRNLHKIQEEKESLPSISHIVQRLSPIQPPKLKLFELWLFKSCNFWKWEVVLTIAK